MYFQLLEFEMKKKLPRGQLKRRRFSRISFLSPEVQFIIDIYLK